MKKCYTLEEARKEIDEIDQKIVEYLAKRNEYIKQIANLKTSVNEVKEESRIDEIITNVRSKAIELDLSPNLVTELYLKMIDSMVEIEVEEINTARKN